MNRLVLTEDQSAFIRESGIKFAVVHPGSYPHNVGRFVLDIIECDDKRAMDAVEVAQGTRKAGKRIVAPPAPADALTAMPGTATGT